MKPKKIRSAMCTIHYNGDPYEAVPDWEKLRFIKRAMGQLEIGDKTLKKHWQIFVECKYPIDVNRLKGLGMHIDIKNIHKHPKAGRAYVRKPTPFVNSRFDWPEEASVFESVKTHRRFEEEYRKKFAKAEIDSSNANWAEVIKMNVAAYEKCSQMESREIGA